jgi:hypothetical protein
VALASLSDERAARGAILVLALGLLVATATLDLPRAGGGEFWGDGATYHAMAWSLAEDGDLRYEARDLFRSRREFASGPQGLFLKRASGGLERAPGGGWRRARPEDGRLYFAKGFAYPLVAAPLVRLLGTRGLLLLNALVLAAALLLGFGLLRSRGHGPFAALAVVTALFIGSVTPVYLVWPTPELFGLGLITAALVAWSAGRPLLSAALFGLAGYLKPPNVLMAAPLGLEPILAGGPRRGLLESLRRGAALAATVAVLYGANAAVTGEANYQGGERKTFYGCFPHDERGSTFEGCGFWMTTEQVGPLVEGSDEERLSSRTGPLRAREEIVESFGWNIFYYWAGRFGGAAAYFPGAVLALVAFLVAGPRDRRGALALLAVVASWLAYIVIIPDNWYGGGGTVGNRYFLAMLPAFLFLVPRGRERLVSAGGLLLAALFLAPILLAPVAHSRRPGDHATRPPFRALPAELTMLNDLSVFTESWRKKRPYGFVGDPRGGRHADPDAYFLYFMDDGTFGRELHRGRAGFWLRGGERAEIVLRAFDLAPVERVVLRVTGGPAGDLVAAGLGWSSERVGVSPGQTREIVLGAGRGLRYYDTYLHVLRLRSRRGAPLPDARAVGAFVEIRLEMGPPFATAGVR